MKGSDSSNQNINIQIAPLNLKKTNKSVSSFSDNLMAVSNSSTNSVVIAPVMPGSIHPPTARSLNVNEVKSCNLTILAKSQSTPNSNNQISYGSNNSIKFVNLSKCAQIPNIKDSTNSSINVQILTTNISNLSSNSINDSHQTLSNASILSVTSGISTTATSVSTNATSSIACTRLILQASQPYLPQGPFTIISSPNEFTNNSISNSPLIKNTSYVVKGNKTATQIRPIMAQTSIIKAQPNKKSPIKPTLSNLSHISSITLSDNTESLISRSSHNSGHTDDQQKIASTVTGISAKTPMKIPLQYSVSNSHNIRLALTGNINPKITTNSKQIQVISPKSRKRPSSPNLLQDSKFKEQTNTFKDDKTNLANFTQQISSGSHSPTRKRARKQHLKSVTTKSQQKPTINAKVISRNANIESTNPYSTIRPALTSEQSPNLHTLNKLSKSEELTSPIRVEIKNPIQITNSRHCNPNTTQLSIQRPTSIFTSNGQPANIQPANNCLSSPTVQIITQNSTNNTARQIQLSGGSTNLILSPKSTCSSMNNKTQLSSSTFSPQKIYIAASHNVTSPLNSNSIIANKSLLEQIKHETPDLSSTPIDVLLHAKDIYSPSSHPPPVKVESFPDIKQDICDDNNELSRYSIYPYKQSWNARRNHYEKKSDIKFRKIRSNYKTNSYSNSTNFDKDCNNSDVETTDICWLLYKATNQIMIQKKYDEENLKRFNDIKLEIDKPKMSEDNAEPKFSHICMEVLERQLSQMPQKLSDNNNGNINNLLNPISNKDYIDPHLFGISNDIHDSSLSNTLSKSPYCINTSSNHTLLSQPHICSISCKYYSSEVYTPPYSPQTIKVLDLLEGLIMKEQRLIEKESEIYDHCSKMLHSYQLLSDQTDPTDNSQYNSSQTQYQHNNKHFNTKSTIKCDNDSNTNNNDPIIAPSKLMNGKRR